MTAAGSSYKGFRFPPEIISHCVWLYHRFPLSLRDVQELMLERGVDVSYETIRAWCDRFGQQYANQLRRRGRRPGDKWHLDEVFVQINGAPAVPVARGRPARQRARHSGPVAPKRGGRKEVLPPTAQGPAVGAQGDRHRQARPLAGGAPRARAVGDPSPVEVPEQPRRELASADPATRAGDETLQVDPARATVTVGVQRHLAALSAPSAPAVGGADYRQGHRRPLRGLEQDHRGDDHGRRLNQRLGQDVSAKPRLITPNHHIGQLGWLKLTVPSDVLAAGEPGDVLAAAIDDELKCGDVTCIEDIERLSELERYRLRHLPGVGGDVSGRGRGAEHSNFRAQDS